MIDRERAQFTMMGLRLREIRERRGLTRAQLAAKVQTTAAKIERWERGGSRSTWVQFHRWLKVAKILKVDPGTLYHPVGLPIRTIRGTEVRQYGKKPNREAISYQEAQRILKCSRAQLERLVNRGVLKRAKSILPQSLYDFIARRAGHDV